MFDGTHVMWGMHWAGWILWLLLIGGIIWLVVGTGEQQPTRPAEDRESPLDTLKRRYAEGEISTEEYEERKERLQREG